MKFSYAKATPSIMRELEVPNSLQEEIEDSILGFPYIVYNLSEKVAMIPEPVDPFSLPDRPYKLIIKECVLNVSETRASDPSENCIMVFVTRESECFDDQVLIDIVRNAFSHLIGARVYELPITVRNRCSRPKTPITRDPVKLIEWVNESVDLVVPGTEKLANDLIMSTIRKDELDAFIQFGRSTEWRGLSPKAKRLYGSLLSDLINNGEAV